MKYLVLIFSVSFLFSLTSYLPEGDPCMEGVTYYSLEEALKEPSKVKVLDLAMQHPKLTTLPPEIGKLTNLECLDVSFNRVSTLPEEMKMLKNLKTLNLAGNRYLAKLPEIIKQIPNLQTLNLSNIPEWSKEKCDQAKAALPNVKVITDK